MNKFSNTDFGNYFPVTLRKMDRVDFIFSIIAASLSIIFYIFLILYSENAAAIKSIGGNWFQSDGWRVFDDLTKFEAIHHRDTVHPLFSISSIPITNLIKFLLNLSSLQSIYVYNSILFAIASVLLFIIVRLIGCNLIDSLLLVALLVTSAASIFWFTVPETYPLGCVSFLCCLLALAQNPKRDIFFVFAGILTLGTTVTNWMAALIASAASRTPRRFVIISLTSFVIVSLGSVAAKAIFPNPGSPFFLLTSMTGEKEFVGHSDSGSVVDILAGELIAPIIAPALQPANIRLSFQSAIPQTVLDGDLPFTIALVALLFILAAAALQIIKHPNRFSISLCAILIGQIILHILYGEETFLYALHFVTLLVVLCAHALINRSNTFVRVAMIVLIFAGTYNNVDRFFNLISVPYNGTVENLYRLNS